jgi:hypothetical protein
MSPSWMSTLNDLLEEELVHGSPSSPFRPAVLRWAGAGGRPVQPHPLLDALEANRIGSRGGSRRYRWSFPVASWIPLEQRVRWRPVEREIVERSGAEHAARLWTPPVLVEHIEWLERQSRGADEEVAARAAILLDEALPALEDDVAARVAGIDSWGDTFLLWAFARRPRALARAPGLVQAIASRYAARAARANGVVLGRDFPFFDVPMPSATAHLASAAARTGEGLELVAPAVEWLRRERRPDDGWGDPGQGTDILTTLAAAELLGFLDPAFDPASALEPIGRLVEERGGRPELIGPEWPWVAAEILAFAAWTARPFRERFRWPHVPDWMIDARVRVPRFEAYLVDARLFERLPGLTNVPVEIGFIDFAGFGAWNSAHGQAAGDDLLALLAAQLRTVPESRTIRDGGDEFLVLGAPMADGLVGRLEQLCSRWPGVSRARFPDLPVVPLRAVVGTAPAAGLRAQREILGRAIGELKVDHPSPPSEGVVRQIA